jgi:hypothetical protein
MNKDPAEMLKPLTNVIAPEKEYWRDEREMKKIKLYASGREKRLQRKALAREGGSEADTAMGHHPEIITVLSEPANRIIMGTKIQA